jgi:hypothetical protein
MIPIVIQNNKGSFMDKSTQNAKDEIKHKTVPDPDIWNKDTTEHPEIINLLEEDDDINIWNKNDSIEHPENIMELEEGHDHKWNIKAPEDIPHNELDLFDVDKKNNKDK